tara:strand:+ start:1630 stop:2103 length:474 start_codon:yes stop_codon:yes gene_type:complete
MENQGIMGMSKLDQIRGMASNMPQNQPMPAQPELMQDMAPEMTQRREEPMVNPQEDAQKLAEAVIKRSGGNPQLAIDIIQNASMIVMNTIEGSTRTPIRAKDGQEIKKSDLNEGLQALAKENEDVVEKITGKKVVDDVEKMQDGGAIMQEMMRLRGY